MIPARSPFCLTLAHFYFCCHTQSDSMSHFCEGFDSFESSLLSPLSFLFVLAPFRLSDPTHTKISPDLTSPPRFQDRDGLKMICWILCLSAFFYLNPLFLILRCLPSLLAWQPALTSTKFVPQLNLLPLPDHFFFFSWLLCSFFLFENLFFFYTLRAQLGWSITTPIAPLNSLLMYFYGISSPFPSVVMVVPGKPSP